MPADRKKKWPKEDSVIPAMLRVVSCAALLALTLCSLAQGHPAPDARRQRAMALEQQGKNQEADAEWRAILKDHPGNPEPLAHIGLLEARLEHYKEAALYDRKALAINPNVPGLRLNLALALFKDGNLKQAVPEFETLRKDASPGTPDYQRATILAGMAYYGLAEYAKAAPYLKEAADRDPNNLPLLLALEHSYLWSNQLKYVLDVYRQILTVNPDSAEADMVAGEALDQMKDNAGATEMFRAAVKADPKQPNAHFGLGYLLWSQKNYAEAAREFQAELANDPQHAQSMLYLADADIQMNQLDQARPLLEAEIKIQPSFPLAHLDLGIIESQAGHNAEALREFTLAAKMDPTDVNAHWRLARLYRTMGKNELANAEFDKARTLNKQADDTLFQKIANGKNRPPQAQALPPNNK
ncbi:MAG TPA: tetratricopeptide repeat protein [Terracidiphilus sp.]|nr:tetratricopeptide repeat protein [Terracidiphilus sp.]